MASDTPALVAKPAKAVDIEVETGWNAGTEDDGQALKQVAASEDGQRSEPSLGGTAHARLDVR